MRPRWCISMASHFACSPTDPSRPLRRTPSRSFQGIPLPYPTRMANKASDFRRFQQGEIEKEGVFCFTLKRPFLKLMPLFGRLSHRNYLHSKSPILNIHFYESEYPVWTSTLNIHLNTQPLKSAFLNIMQGHWRHHADNTPTKASETPSKAV